MRESWILISIQGDIAICNRAKATKPILCLRQQPPEIPTIQPIRAIDMFAINCDHVTKCYNMLR